MRMRNSTHVALDAVGAGLGQGGGVELGDDRGGLGLGQRGILVEQTERLAVGDGAALLGVVHRVAPERRAVGARVGAQRAGRRGRRHKSHKNSELQHGREWSAGRGEGRAG